MKITGILGVVGSLIVCGALFAAEPPAPADSSAAAAAPAQREAAIPAQTATNATTEAAVEKGAEKSEPAKPAAPAAAPAAAATAAGSSPLDQDAEFQRIAKQYTKVEQQGRTMYCKREHPLGSRLPVTQCLTEGELADQVRNTGQIKEQMRTRPKGLPTPGG
jgi:hypothetical protein